MKTQVFYSNYFQSWSAIKDEWLYLLHESCPLISCILNSSNDGKYDSLKILPKIFHGILTFSKVLFSMSYYRWHICCIHSFLSVAVSGSTAPPCMIVLIINSYLDSFAAFSILQALAIRIFYNVFQPYLNAFGCIIIRFLSRCYFLFYSSA